MIKRLVILAVLFVLVAFIVQAQTVTIIEGTQLYFNVVQGQFGEWYAYCVQGCDQLLPVASVNEIYQSHATQREAFQHSLVLTGRVFNFTPPPLP